jgi:hypothetical protein
MSSGEKRAALSRRAASVMQAGDGVARACVPVSRWVSVAGLVLLPSSQGPLSVTRYEKYLELLREAASTGREAAAVIQRSLQGLRDS